jgi:glycosyltransferase involved in cell wall biosynthesis
MVARLLREKGVYDFVEAARLVRRALPEARFVLVGAADTNPSAVSADELARWEAEGVVEVRGRLEDPRPAYAEAHVFVLPSFYREGTPRTNLEAMAMGRAVITTDAPGCRETVRPGETGLLVPMRDPAALATAMIELGRDLARARRMGAAGRAFCEQRYALDVVTRHTVGLMLGEEHTGLQQR